MLPPPPPALVLSVGGVSFLFLLVGFCLSGQITANHSARIPVFPVHCPTDFVVLGLHVQIFDPFWVDFLHSERWKSSFFCTWMSSLPRTIIKRIFIFQCMLELTVNKRVHSWFSVPLDSFYFGAIILLFGYYSFAVCFELRNYNAFSFPFSTQDCFGTLGLEIPYKFSPIPGCRPTHIPLSSGGGGLNLWLLTC